MTATTFTIQLHKGQRRAYESLRRFVYMIAGSGGGKTVFGPVWLMREIERRRSRPNAEQQYLVASPDFPLLVRTTFPALSPYMRAIGATWVAGERRFLLPWGNDTDAGPGPSVWIGSASHPQSLEGVHLAAAWLDEFGQVEDLAHDTVIRRLAFFEGRALFTTTPYRSTGWVRRIRDVARAGTDLTIEWVQFPSWWNPAYPLDEYLRLKRTLPAWQAAMFLDAELSRPEGAIYPIWDESVHVVAPPAAWLVNGELQLPKDWSRYEGYDAGSNNPTAILHAAVTGDDVLYLYDERYESNSLTKQHALWINSRTPKAEIVAVDPSARDTILDIRSFVVPAYGADNDFITGVDEVYERLVTGRLYVLAGTCPNMRREIETYVYAEGRDRPVKENDHAMDALRYLCKMVKLRRGGATVKFN